MRPGPWLALDASLGAGTIALIDVEGPPRLLAAVTVAERDALFAELGRVLADAGCPIEALGACVVGDGPGSFTALRIVGAMGKGLAEATGMPLYAVPSLALVVAGTETTATAGTWFATMDALRGEQYVARVVTDAQGMVREVGAMPRIARESIPAAAVAAGARWIGPDAPLVALPDARGAVRCVEWLRAAGPVDLAAWEPTYGRLAEAQAKWEAEHGRPLAP
ncbi:MAG: tRNA (adenosine(37)-N6)-threonylcarbamoyltransferase complex dimerization subunit type 1 TsaB [Gemmatimonadota bacterium]|jgi:tRNA threonylcarbamoyl adenosine modification protein YeaZ|nr:tRNA (adenosine(37)-N6)-threonylcarbamoyltransferase complex dimerization subunit type 1 TsaB [Gemmatimonadota bacterium]MDQ8149160.1 tRNA (adenosine(37)-N6)-threonylcarbamoyltransferase complex dimerization subunit type 1 TsaB [Gemmatimonadota bacterium]MDQ8176096.1 tRNA (adenosine(37)-N6)-threonylcarbamoyltransferase complex dimerization subunit type 1 TsaB [Gemmatimonadota bacterium]